MILFNKIILLIQISKHGIRMRTPYHKLMHKIQDITHIIVVHILLMVWVEWVWEWEWVWVVWEWVDLEGCMVWV